MRVVQSRRRRLGRPKVMPEVEELLAHSIGTA